MTARWKLVFAAGPALAGVSLMLSAIADAQPTTAQQNAIRQSCRSDFMTHCSGVTPGGADALACLQQHLGGFGNVLRVASGAGRFDHFIGLDDRLIDIREGDIRGDFDHHRAWPSHLEQVEGTSHDFRDLFRLVERLDPLGDRVIRTR